MVNFYLGCDVSKGYSDFTLINENKAIAEPNFQLDDTKEGHISLEKFLSGFLERNPEAIIYAAVESTGGYENNWYNLFSQLHIQQKRILIARVNPRGTNHNGQASLKRTITDKVSARNIAEYLINHKDKIIYDAIDLFAPLRKQWTFIRMVGKQKTQYSNELNQLLYIANPELLSYCTDGYPQWLLNVLLKFPTAKHLAKAKKVSLVAIKYVSAEKAEDLIVNAKNTVAAATDELTAETIKITVEQILHLKRVADLQITSLAKIFPLPEEMEILKSFKGISDYSAMGLLMNIKSIDNFENTKKIASFFGLNPLYKQSGDGTWGNHMSKQGASEVRHLLYNITITAIQHNALIKQIYVNHLQKGKTKMTAIGACMHKILRIVFGMLKNKEAYNPEKDIKLRERSVAKSPKAAISDSDRRFQTFSGKAPISRRQTKKRKEAVIELVSQEKEKTDTSQIEINQ